MLGPPEFSFFIKILDCIYFQLKCVLNILYENVEMFQVLKKR